MRLRTRLVLAFLYILLTAIIALGVPLAWTLQNRARSEFRTNLLVTARSSPPHSAGEASSQICDQISTPTWKGSLGN